MDLNDKIESLINSYIGIIIFKNLNSYDQKIISGNTGILLEIIYYKFNLKNQTNFINQMKMNNYRDCISLTLLLLPYIDTQNNYEYFNKVESLQELLLKKKVNYDPNDKSKNYYKYTNIQFDLFNLNNNNNVEEFKDIEELLTNNLYYLLSTIETIAYKIYPNWLNIYPISSNYVESELYKNTFNNKSLKWFKQDITWWDYTDENDRMKSYKGITINDIYNIFVNYYFLAVKDFFYLIEDDNIFKLDKEFVNSLINNKYYSLLDNNQKYNFLSKLKNLKFKKKIEKNFEENYDYINIKILNNKEKKDNREIDNLEIDVNEDTFNYYYDYFLIIFNKLKLTPYLYLYFDYKDNKFELKDKDDILINNIPIPNLKAIDFFEFGIRLYYKDKDILNKNNNKKKYIDILKKDNNKEEHHSHLFSGLSVNEKNEITNRIVNSKAKIKLNLKNIIFDTMTKLGLLSEYIYNLEITDLNLLDKDKDKRQKYIKKILKDKKIIKCKKIIGKKNKVIKIKDQYEESYFYVNNLKYKDQRQEKEKDKNGNYKSFFDIIFDKKFDGYLTYTMDWITQINFYNKYLNKRIIFITGATGQGKSVHVPKLILYSTKMLDYNLYGKTIITQPRISPVLNVKYISDGLMVPIEEIIKNKKIRTENGYLQFDYSGDTHINKYIPYFVRMVTDGKLLNEILGNILLKEKKNINKYEFKYKYENIFDNIVIDESHEHNKNMDIILTFMKYSLLFNLSLKLFIVSATMDEDEYVLRRYYRVINDDLSYPFNKFMFNKPLLKIYNDRRFHISPPGETTQYTITEIYNSFEPNSMREAIIEGIDIVNKILGSSNSGELLFFTDTTKNCNNIAKHLNKITGSTIVAIPFYAGIVPKYKKWIENLSDDRNNINFDKNIIVDIFNGGYNIDNIKVNRNNNYDRIIIIATNVAEASITINTLKFVIDTGYVLDVSYDYNELIDIIETKKITEASRLQRKGRVGRKSSGTVYYTYMKHSREDIKAIYSINKSKIDDTIYGILYKNYLDIPLFNNINYFSINNSDVDIEFNNYLPEFKFLKEYFWNNDGTIIKLNKCNIITTNLIFLNNEFDKKNNIYSSGVNFNNILDEKGYFYLIHPNDNEEKRDLYKREILNDNKKFKNDKIKIIIKNLTDKNLLVDFNIKSDFNIDNIKLAKTDINDLLSKISKSMKSFEYNNNYSLLFIYGYLYKCIDDIIIIISFLKGKGYSLKNLYEKKGFNFNFNFKKRFKNNYGDIWVLLKLFNEFIKIFDNIIPKKEKIDENYNNDLKNFKKNYYNLEKIDDNFIENDYNNIIKNLIQNKNIIKVNKYNKYNIEIDKLLDNPNYINWCKINYINKLGFLNILKNYIKIHEEYAEFKLNENEIKNNFYDILNKKFSSNISKDNNINIQKCIILTYGMNLVEYKGNNNYYHYNSAQYFTNTLLKSNINETITIPKQYLIFFNKVNNNEINMLLNIDIKYLFELVFNIYNLINSGGKKDNIIKNFNYSKLNEYLIQLSSKNKNNNTSNFNKLNELNINELNKNEYKIYIKLLEQNNYFYNYIAKLVNYINYF